MPSAAPIDLDARAGRGGPEGAQRRVVGQPAADVAEQVRGRVPAAAGQQQVAGDLAALRADEGGGDAVGSPGAVDVGARRDGDAALRAAPGPERGRRRPGVEHLDRGAGVVQVDRGGVGGVVAGEDDDLAAGEHAVPVQEVPRRRGEHDARAVVVLEHDRALDRAGRDHDPGGADAVHPLARAPREAAVVGVGGAPLEREHEAVVVVPERRRALEVRDVRRCRELGDDLVDDLQGGAAVDRLGAGERAAGGGAVVDEDDVVAATGRGAGGDEPGRAGADHQDVAVGVQAVVAGEVGDLGEPALPVHAAGDEPVGGLDGGGQQHRLRERLLDLHQARRVLGPRGADAAGPSQLHAGAGRTGVVREQHRGQRVAGVARVGGAVHGDRDVAAAVDAAVALDAAHGVASGRTDVRAVVAERGPTERNS